MGRVTHEYGSAGITDILRIRPVLKYASRKVIDPRVKKVHYEHYSIAFQ